MSVENIEMKIEHNKPLNANQVAVFYSTLSAILAKIDPEAEVVPCEGSLITKIKTTGKYLLPVVATSLINAFLNPQKEHIASVFNCTNCFNNSSFKLFSINETVIYNKDNIAQKNLELKEKLPQKTSEVVETLQMIITSETIIKKETIKKAGKSYKETFQFTAKFDDARYSDDHDIKIITKEGAFKNVVDVSSDCYFIADGKLFKDGDKYVKFEITNLVKQPQRKKFLLI